MSDTSLTTLDAWLEDRADLPQWRTVNMYHAALEYGINDQRQVANAIALVESAHKLQEKFPNLTFDAIVNALLVGVYPEAEPYWWTRFQWHRMELWTHQQRENFYWWRHRIRQRYRTWRHRNAN
jgi:hypothetical protein